MERRSFFYVPAMRADPTAGGDRPRGCVCAWYLTGESGHQYWAKGDDHASCPVSSSVHGAAQLRASRRSAAGHPIGASE